MSASVLAFGRYRIHPEEKLLRRNGQAVPLPPKAVDTLLTLLEASGEVVSRETLLKRVWPDVVVDENNLTQQISLLRRTLSEEEHEPAVWIETVPKRGYRFAVPVLTEESPPEARNEPLSPPTGRRLWPRWAIAPLLLCVATGALILRPAREARAIAVMPLQPLTTNEDLSALGLGIADAVTQRLSHSQSIEVRPLASMRRFIAKPTDPLTAGRELRADMVMSGVLQRIGDRIRVTLELIDVESQRSIWSAKFEEPSDDPFRLQDMIAEATLRSLPGRTGASESVRSAAAATPGSPHVYEAYLKGRYYWSRRTGGDIGRAIEQFQRAVQGDPEYAPAWAGLADSLNQASLHAIAEPSQTFPRARAAAERAIHLDQNQAEAHAAIGFTSFYYDWDFARAEKHLQRAIALDPRNGTFRQWLSNLYMATGRVREGLAQIDEAVRGDPASLMVRAVSGRQRYLARRYVESENLLRQTVSLDSSFAPANLNLAMTLMESGRRAEAQRLLERANQLGSTANGLTNLAILAARNREPERARHWLAEARRLNPNYSPYEEALVYAALNEPELALANLDRAFEQRYSGMVWLNADPRLDPVREHPRFQELIRRVGLPRQTR